MITKPNQIVSKAGKAKNRKWDSQQRFSTGHDTASLALLSELDTFKRNGRERRPVCSAWHSPTFQKSYEERVQDSAQRLIDSGRVSSFDEAVERAQAAMQMVRGVQIGAETVVVQK